MAGDQWYLRTQDETFGPEPKSRLIEWARMGRIQPGQEISADGETWQPVTEAAFLEMRWSIDIGDGHPRGPFNKHAAKALLASGRLPPGSRIVCVDGNPEESAAKAEEPREEAAEEPAGEAAEVAEPVAEPREEVAEEVSGEKAGVDLEEVERLRAENGRLAAEVETVHAGIKSAEARAADAEARVAQVREELKAAVKAGDRAEARVATLEAEIAAIRKSELAAKTDAEKARREVTAAEAKAAKAENSFADLFSSAQASEEAYENRIRALSEELRRMPPTAQLAADAQAAMYALMKDEAEELAAALEAETKEIEALRQYRRERSERLLARRQEILRRIGSDAEDMTRRALKAYPEDPRTVHLRQELDAMRIVVEKNAQASNDRIAELTEKLRTRDLEASRLREQAADVTALYRQLQDTREKLQLRERELMEERQRSEQERREQAATQQALLARLSELEVSLPGGTNQSREARSVKLPPWMGLRK